MRTTIVLLLSVALPAAACSLAAFHDLRAEEPAAAAAAVETSATPRTRLYVKTIPPGAQVTLDGKPLGPSDGLFLVPAGTAKVSVLFDNAAPQVREIEIAEGCITRLEINANVTPSPVAAEATATGPDVIAKAFGGFGGGPLPADSAATYGFPSPWEISPMGGSAIGRGQPILSAPVLRILSNRAPVSPAPLSTLDEILLTRLAKQVAFTETPLHEVRATIRDVAGVELLIDENALTERGVPPDAPVSAMLRDLSLAAALDAVVAPLGLAWIVRDNLIEVTGAERVRERRMVHIHDVSDLADAAGLNGLIVLIGSCVEPDSWGVQGGPGAMKPVVSSAGTSIVVSHAWPQQWQVAKFLEALRRVKAQPPEARRPLAATGIWSDAASVVAARTALDKPVTVDVQETPLPDVLRNVLDMAGTPIAIDDQAFLENGIAIDTPVTFTLRAWPLSTALDSMLAPLGMTYTFIADRLVVTSRERAEETLSTAVYPLAEGLDAANLPQTLIDTVAPGSWETAGGGGTVRWVDGDLRLLVVRQTTAGHRAVDALLRGLPKNASFSTNAPSATPASKPR